MSYTRELFQELKRQDDKYREADWDHTWNVVEAFYSNQAEQYVRQYLRRFGLGLPNDDHPQTRSLVEYVTTQLAVIYRSPPTRRIAGASEAKALREAYTRSRVDSMLREVDRLRTRDRQCIIRLYPSDTSRCVRLVPFGPTAALRWSEGPEPDDIRTDRAFALKTAAGVELWHRLESDPLWRMLIVDENTGMPIAEQPYGETGLSPYAELPVVIVYDGVPVKGPWLPPRQSWAHYSLRLSGWANEIDEQIRSSAHVERYFTQQVLGDVDTENDSTKKSDLPPTFGPGMSHLLPEGMGVEKLEMRPVIRETLEAMTQLIDSWLQSESLNPKAYRSSQEISALGLMVDSHPRRERQESMKDFALEAESRLWSAYAAMHNVHAPVWKVPQLPADKEIEVELGTIDIPYDEDKYGQHLARLLALQLVSPIEAIMRERRIGRDEAVAAYERVQADFDAYPVGDATKVAKELPGVGEDDAPNPAASTVDAVRAKSEDSATT